MVVLFNITNMHAGCHIDAFSISHYTTENGLPQNSIKAITNDQLGFYWLATEGGLVRFDGRNFRLFDKANTGIGSNRIVDIMKDVNAGSLFAVTEQGATMSIEKGKSVLSAKNVQDHFSQMGLPVGFQSYFHHTWSFGQEQYFNFEQDTILLPMSPKLAALLTKGRVSWFLSQKEIAAYPISKEIGLENIFNIGQDLYVLQAAGKQLKVLRITPQGATTIALTGDLQERSASPVICVNNATGQTFISSGDCLYLVERDATGNLNTTLLLSGFDFKKKVITAACYDKEQDMLLLGSNVDGLYVLKRKYFQVRVISDLASSYNVVQDQVIYNDSSILTDKGIVFSTGLPQPYFLPQAKTTMKYAGSRIMKTQQSVWAVSGSTLYQYAPDFTTLIQKWSLDFSVSDLAEVQGQLWLGSYDGRVFSINYASGNSNPRFVCTVKTHVHTIKAYQGSAWIGTKAGLYRFDLKDRKLKILKALEGKTVRAVYPLGENELWIGTYDAGFYLYQNGKVKHFPPDKNNYLTSVHCILEDDKGRLWVSTNHGIFLMRKRDLLAYDEKSASIPYYLHFNKEAGFISDEFNGGDNRTGLKLPNGAFCFSSMKGWVFFYPDSVKGMVPDKEMIIDRMETGNTEMPSAESLVLENAFDPVTITIATAYFGNPDNLQYEYRFDDGKWMFPENNQVTFNALSSGDHVLHIRKRVGFGNQYAIKTVKVHVVPAWWETWTFRIVVLLVAVILLWLAFRLRFYLLKKRNKHLEEAVALQTQKLEENINALKQSEERLTKENKFQQRLTNHIAHDVRTPLKYLTLSSAHLYHSIKRKENPKEEDAWEIYKATEQIFHFTGRLISYFNVWTVASQPKEQVAVAQLVEQKFNIFGLAAKERDIELINLVPVGQTIFSHVILVDILLHNLLDNSIKHTTQGTVNVKLETTQHDTIIIISDTGKGIAPQEMKEYNEYLNDEHKPENKNYTGLGFSIIKNILPLINARLILLHNHPQGIVIRLSIPVTFK